jgi:adenylate cyclase
MAKGLENQPIRRVEGQWRVGDYRIPVDSSGHFYIRFLGEPDETFLRVPYESVYAGVLNAGVSAEVYRPIFRNKMVLVGDATTGTGDRLKTPVGDMAGVEMHAHAVATLLQRGFVRVAPPWVNFGVLCLLTAIVCPLAAVWRLQWAALVTAGLMAGYSLFNVWLFVDHDLWLHWVAPSAAMVMAKLGVFLERGLTEEREKKRMLGLLQRYVSPQIAAYVIDHPDKCILGGEQVTATVLFSDIRGFTAMSEKLTPKQVVERLNEYLQAMTDVVFERDGAVDKYVGDCIMALFGIPVPHLDHARRAVATAIDMQAALLKLQAKWRAEGLPLIEIGVGVNTGEMVVGNIGAQQRLDFTVIGDAVNLASRVESLNKEMHTRILITESTYQFVKDEVEARGPLTAHVKGKEEEIVVYEVFGWRTPSEGEGNLQRSVRVYVN